MAGDAVRREGSGWYPEVEKFKSGKVEKVSFPLFNLVREPALVVRIHPHLLSHDVAHDAGGIANLQRGFHSEVSVAVRAVAPRPVLMKPCDALPSNTQSSSWLFSSATQAPAPLLRERTTKEATSPGGVTVSVADIAVPL